MIDEACRLGFKVFYGDRQIMGAVAHRAAEITIKGRLWIHLGDDLTWHYVKAGEVLITNKPFTMKRGETMATGKRQDGRSSHVGSKTKTSTKESAGGSAGASRVAPRFPSMTGGNIKEIDQAGAALLDIQDRKKQIVADEKLANETVVRIMKKHKRDHYSYDQLEVWVEAGKAKAKAKHKAPKKLA